MSSSINQGPPGRNAMSSSSNTAGGTAMSSSINTADGTAASHVKLWQMGFKQEMPRTLSLASNAACAVSVMSCWTTGATFSAQGLAYGGPVAVIWGWLLVSCASLAVAACLAELVSAFPTSGGLYYWTFVLAPARHRAIACWMTGWLSLLGNVAFTASTELLLAQYLAALVRLYTSGPQEQPGVVLSPYQLLALFAGLLVLHACMNCGSHHLTRMQIVFSGFWQVVATLAFCALLIAVAPGHTSPNFAFGTWLPNTELTGLTNPVHIFLVGVGQGGDLVWRPGGAGCWPP
ncbi:amino acid permease-domain-containing protein [Haematococcus lacustris]